MLVAAFVSLGIVSTYVEKQFAVETKAEREDTFIHSGCLEVNSVPHIPSRLANKRMRKALFTNVVYNITRYLLLTQWQFLAVF